MAQSLKFVYIVAKIIHFYQTVDITDRSKFCNVTQTNSSPSVPETVSIREQISEISARLGRDT